MLFSFRCSVKYILLLVLGALLMQCTNVDRNYKPRPLQSPYTMNADAYQAMAENHVGEERNALLLLAAGRLIDEGDWQQGQEILSQIEAIHPTNKDKKRLLLAKIDLIQKKPKLAIKRLAKVRELDDLSTYDKAEYYQMLAKAYKQTGRHIESIQERVKLEAILPDSMTRDNNRRALWLALISLPEPELNTLAIEAREGSAIKGWASLALIAKSHTADNAGQMLKELKQWDWAFPKHAARSLLPGSLENMEGYLLKKPRQIALLLPLSGPLSGPGQAVQDGFMSAFRAQGDVSETNLRLYDTHKVSASKAYHQAIQDGADYVIGPLSKKNVAKVAGLTHPVPTILLNYVDTRTDDNAYQFGLSPPNEARQVAVRARQAGLSRALLIAPQGAWGDEVLGAFGGEFERHRGHVVDVLRFDPDAPQNLNADIRGLLQAVPDEERKKQLKALAKDPDLDVGPLRREDFDMVFLLSYPSNARQIMPLLRYYYAGKVPVYATSSVYSGSQNTMADRDLDGITFCDMPWVFKNPGAKSHAWPEGFNSYTRLYALGIDSYNLSHDLNALLLFPALGTENQTGALYLSSEHIISRILPFGVFQSGMAKPV